MEEDREGEKYDYVRETSVSCLSHAPSWTWPTTQAHALTQNQIGNLLVCRLGVQTQPQHPGRKPDLKMHNIVCPFTLDISCQSVPQTSLLTPPWSCVYRDKADGPVATA